MLVKKYYMNSSQPSNFLYKAIFKLMQPLVRIFLRNGMPFAAFSEIAKQAYVKVAEKEFAVPGKKQTNSRISTITGLTRKEVQRIKSLDEEQDSAGLVERYNRAARVVFGWVHDPKYSRNSTTSIDLPLDGESPSFSTLVKEYSGDMPPRAILDELIQVGVAKKLPDENIRLLERAYIPKASAMEKLQYLGSDVSGLISTMDRNIYLEEKKPFFQRKVFYDNLTIESTEVIQKILADKGQYLLEILDQHMAENDRDINPDVKGTGKKAAGIGLYYFEEEQDNSNKGEG